MVTIIKKTDVALIALLIIFAAAFYFIFGGLGGEGGVVTISSGGAVYRELPLSRDAEVEIFSSGAARNTLVIKDGQAYMAYADCPDGICLRHRPIRLSGEMIVCLPNRIVVEISGGAAGYDAVAG